jgi:adenosylhomocysteinase
MSFANQFMALLHLTAHGRSLEHEVYTVGPDQDQEIAGVKLETMGVGIDRLTPEQIAYRDSYAEGT